MWPSTTAKAGTVTKGASLYSAYQGGTTEQQNKKKKKKKKKNTHTVKL